MSPSWNKTARGKHSSTISAAVYALEHSSEDVDESWTVFRDSSAMDSLGPVSRKHQDWFDENDKEIQGLLEEKHQKTQGLPQKYQLSI